MEHPSYTDEHKHYILPTTIESDEREVLVRGEGVWVYDSDGKRYFDACSQVSCANIGHNHPRFAKWMEGFWRWAGSREEMITTAMGTDFFYRNFFDIGKYRVEIKEIELSPVALAKRLAPHIFGADNTVFGFHTSGAQAVNIAVRFFRTVTGKPHIIAFEKGFHGRDGEARDVSSSNPMHWDEAPRSGNVFFLPYPETREDALRALAKLNDIPLKKCAAVIYEPVQGEGGGMRVGKYLTQIETILQNEGVSSISDEVQAGLGRCGMWWGYQALGLNPDAIVIGKTLGSGHPVSATAFRRDRCDIAAFPPGKISGTFSMSPVGMAAANFTMQIYEEEQIVEKAAALSPALDRILKRAAGKAVGTKNSFHPDGIGCFRSIKLHTADKEKRDALVRRLRECRVWTLDASRAFPAIRITPPLVATEAEMNFLALAIEKAILSV